MKNQFLRRTLGIGLVALFAGPTYAQWQVPAYNASRYLLPRLNQYVNGPSPGWTGAAASVAGPVVIHGLAAAGGPLYPNSTPQTFPFQPPMYSQPTYTQPVYPGQSVYHYFPHR